MDAYIKTKLFIDTENLNLDKKFKEGKIEGKIEIAKKMLLKNKSMEDILEFTDLSIEEIEKIKQNFKK